MTTSSPSVHGDPGDFRVTVDRGVAEIVMSRPERRNALGAAAVAELGRLYDELDANPEVAVILLYGEGAAFCAGADLSEFSSELGRSPYDYHDRGEGWVHLMLAPRRLSVPLVVAAHGFALAGGCGIVASADLAIAAAGTQFGVSEIKVGLFPIIVYPTLQRAVGRQLAKRMALTGARIDAAQALASGLVHEVVPPDELVDRARRLAAELAVSGRHALRLGKWLIGHVEDLDLEPATRLAQAVRGAFLSTPDFAEGVTAFVEKRPPRFR